ncbi:MAG: polysaccharide deacetylase family protein [Micrococcaceae bacterium]|uniref:polysaccharide deacetylase family protein n=1 Tax=Arthrobacter sp. AOP36-C1-22 TaxID=3457683 RepID=UPI00264AEA58|nr:polysaccharide deacetylase family protein [Micrococcaceae bacterium]
MSSARRTRSTGALLLSSALAVSLGLSGCAAESGGQEGPPGGGAWASGPGLAPDGGSEGPSAADQREAAIDEARTAAAHYDYSTALEQLEDLEGGDVSDLIDKITAQQKKAVTWEDNSKISHLFFHSLIVDPKRAFAPGPSAQGYADYMVTVKEFKAILASVYDKGYVLVNPHDIARENADGEMEYRPIKLPQGKKPLVLSEDDVSYYEYMDGDGFATNLTLDDDGNITNTYQAPSGTTVHGDYDLPTVVDAFVREHPDFSYHGSKGILGLTGYNGVLGYRTSEIEYGDDPEVDVKAQTRKAKKVAGALKDEGWVFASHTWGHSNVTNSTMARLKADTRKWDQEVSPILGDTDLLIFPFGADMSGIAAYSGAKYELFKKAGFDFYFGIDASTPAWMQLTDDYVRQARINVDGLSMNAALKGKHHVLEKFFDVEEVIDPARSRHAPKDEE